jgi:glutamine synthetase
VPFLSDIAQQFLREHPDTAFVDVMIADINGVLRGKRMAAASLAKVYHGEFVMPISLFATQITGDCVEQTGLVLETGDTDMACLPVDDTLSLSAWQRKPMAQLLVAMQDEKGAPLPFDPRQVLRKSIERLAARGLTAVVAIELEFYLCDRERDVNGKPQPPLSPVTGLRNNDTQVYGLIELDEYQALVDDIASIAASQGIPATTAVAEYAPGQFEINLQHVADPMLACDHGILLKRLIKGVAARHGYDASFMAKPYSHLASSGLHVHISLLDEHGQNIFREGVDSVPLKHAVAGLLRNMNDSLLLYAPHGNSYHRYESGGYVPMAPGWGFNNRTVAVRIPGSKPDDTRIEHRLGGADANPYLATAGIIAGILDGLEQHKLPPPAIAGNAHKQLSASIPATWHAAIECFANSEFCRGYLGEEFCEVYAAVKRSECEMYSSIIPAFEYDWYFRTT